MMLIIKNTDYISTLNIFEYIIHSAIFRLELGLTSNKIMQDLKAFMFDIGSNFWYSED
jgi:hypothetical protein